MISSIEFHTPLGESYFRNNRSTGQKSMRCFPSCSEKGHITGGKCGVPLCVTVTLSGLNFNFDELVFLAEIRPTNAPRMSGMQHVNKKTVLEHLRSKNERGSINGELFIAEVEQISSVKGQVTAMLTFNAQHCSWDYSWKSNRWSGPVAYHVIDIIAMRSVSAEQYLVCSHAESSQFIIASSHKKPGSAPAAETKSELKNTTKKSVPVRAAAKPVHHAQSSEETVALVTKRPYIKRKKPAAAESAEESEMASVDVLSRLARKCEEERAKEQRRQLDQLHINSNYTTIDDDAALALISLVKPTSYVYDINRSRAMQRRQQQQQMRGYNGHSLYHDSSSSDSEGEDATHKQRNNSGSGNSHNYNNNNRRAMSSAAPRPKAPRLNYEELSHEYIVLPMR